MIECGQESGNSTYLIRDIPTTTIYGLPIVYVEELSDHMASEGDRGCATGLCSNLVMKVDPNLMDVSLTDLTDLIGVGTSIFNTVVRLEPVEA